GMTNQQAQEILDQVAAEGLTPVYEGFAQAFRSQVIEEALSMQVEYGLIDIEKYYRLHDYYKHYVPLQVEDDYFEDVTTYADKGMPGATIWKSKGADYIDYEQRVNPLTQAL